jgi:sarcosine oxidase
MSADEQRARAATPAGGRAEDVRADVAVIGLGTMGSMALWRIARLGGPSVVGVEQYGVAHSHGSFTGESRLFRTAYHEGTRYVPTLLRARELWHELEAESGRRLLLQVGTLSIGHESDTDLGNVLASVREFGLPHEVLRTADLRERYPQHAVGDGAMGVLDVYGGGLRPELSVLSAVEQAQAHGATVLANERVLSVEPGGGSVTVTTDRRVITAGRVVIAEGSWSRRLSSGFASTLVVQPLPLIWFMPHHLDRFVPERFPAFIRDEGGVHFFGAPSLDGYSVKVTPRRFHDPVADVADVPSVIDAERLRAIGVAAQRFLPDLNPEPVHWGVFHDAFTANHVPIVDIAADGAVLTLAGFSGHGFKLAPAIGEIAAEFATDRVSELIADDYAIAAHPRIAEG